MNEALSGRQYGMTSTAASHAADRDSNPHIGITFFVNISTSSFAEYKRHQVHLSLASAY
jgi:hypothetical protein